jgi:hypothetical protein
LHKIGHVLQIVVHQLVHKTNAKKNSKSVENWPPFIPMYTGICRISTKEKKSIPYKPYVHGKHVESILGTRENMTKKVFNLNNTIPHSVRLVDPLQENVKGFSSFSSFVKLRSLRLSHVLASLRQQVQQ